MSQLGCPGGQNISLNRFIFIKNNNHKNLQKKFNNFRYIIKNIRTPLYHNMTPNEFETISPIKNFVSPIKNNNQLNQKK
jgi:hypothetical protein